LPLNGLEGVSYAYGLNHYEVDRPLRDVMAVYTKLRNDLSPLSNFAGALGRRDRHSADSLRPYRRA